MEHYLVIIEHQDLPSGRLYGAFAPDLPGCTATGTTVEQTIARMQHSLGAALHSLRVAGRQAPTAHSYEDHKRAFGGAGESLTNVVVALVACSEAEEQAATAQFMSG
jgi:predicted RNase H-like HicB family nuclease